jgi:hypothetical protein
MPSRLPVLILWMLLPVWPCTGQTDDFDDGNDSGWTRFDPIGQAVGQPFAVIQVQSGQYRLSSAPTPDSQLGPARAGSYRADAVYSSFVVVVDVTSWNAALDQAIGILARLQSNPSIGTLGGYSLNYQPGDLDIEINRLVNEQPVNLARVPLNLPPGESYRFVFCGSGSQLTAAVYSLEEPLLPIVTLSAVDATYASGHCGIFCFDASDTGAVDVIFDSYAAGPGTPPELAFAVEGGNFSVSWPRLTGAWHLETCTDPAVWTGVVLDGELSGHQLKFSAPMAGRRFYRLAEGWQAP